MAKTAVTVDDTIFDTPEDTSAEAPVEAPRKRRRRGPNAETKPINATIVYEGNTPPQFVAIIRNLQKAVVLFSELRREGKDANIMQIEVK